MNDLPSLTSLRLYENALTGSLPKELGDLKRLTFLAIGSSEITGTIPNEIMDLKKLKSLRIYETKITGSISDKISDLKYLETVSFAGNKLTGSIPDQFFKKVRGLKALALSGNVSNRNGICCCRRQRFHLISYFVLLCYCNQRT